MASPPGASGLWSSPTHLNEAVKKAQETVVICPPVVSQFAALGALAAGAAFRAPRIAALARTREIVLGELEALRGRCDVSPSEGAFYLFLRLHTDAHPMTLVERLIREHGVAVMPGRTSGRLMAAACASPTAACRKPWPPTGWGDSCVV